MILNDFRCLACSHEFEQLVQKDEKAACPKCQSKNTERLLPQFRVGGRGDLREGTDHGCHGPDHTHHDHSHHKKGTKK